MLLRNFTLAITLAGQAQHDRSGIKLGLALLEPKQPTASSSPRTPINLIALKCDTHSSSDEILGIGSSKRAIGIGITFTRLYNKHSQDIKLPARLIVVPKIALKLPSTPLAVTPHGM